ncbi:MAG: hypothetical protein LLG14_12385 [Nocardiaceae bacterium]|nr:hypothetical protein [Nocardiaceae bacterium]
MQMPGLSAIVLGSVPLFGGALLGAAAGKFRAPDIHGILIKEMDLLSRIPPEQEATRAEVQRVVTMHIDDMVKAADRSHSLLASAVTYQGNWRDIVLFICTVLFAIIWWDVDHNRTNWLTMFIVLIILAFVTAGYALRGLYGSLRSLPHSLGKRTETG